MPATLPHPTSREPFRLPELRVRVPADFEPISEDIFETTIVPQFERVVARQPDRPAIVRGSQVLTYGQLNNAANHIAHQILHELGSDSSPVAILADDEVVCVAAALGVAKSGMPYIMLYPGSPEDHAVFLEDSRAGLLITMSSLQESILRIPPERRPTRTLRIDDLRTAEPSLNPNLELAPDAPFAIYYTSGSTGRPKGVVDGHMSRSYRAYANINALRLAPSDRVGMVLSVWHAGTLSSLLSTFVSGATLFPLDLRTGSTPDAAAWMVRERITALTCTPSVLRAMLQNMPDGLLLSDLRFMRLGGEAISAADMDLFKLHTARDCLLNLVYATSEASAVSEYAVYHDTPPFEGLTPAGEPLPGVEVFLLDEDGKAVAQGDLGEICVSSPFLALGYWHDPELTARVFTPHPADPSKRICHTGDLGRWRPDGLLDIVGRTDTQVKVRGFRVQLEALDLVLRSLPGVAEAAAVVDRPNGRSARLVAYLAMHPGQPFSVSRFRRELSRRLPTYAVPSLLIQLPAIPRGGLGKVARRELPPPSQQRPAIEAEYVAPSTEVETRIASVWEGILGLKGIGVNDSFFELGGDSLSALEMALEVEKTFGVKVPQSFFANPTIAALAQSPSSESPGPTPSTGFVLSSHRSTDPATVGRKRKRRRQLTPGRILTRAYSWRDVDRLMDRLVLRTIVRQPYADAIRWAARWSKNPAVLRLFYGRRRALFELWLQSWDLPLTLSSDLFPTNVLTNLIPRWRVGVEAAEDIGSRPYAASKLRNAYSATLAAMLKATPVGGLPDLVQVAGLEHLRDARRQGRGVIVLSFHGQPGPGYLLPVERLLGLDRIPTISWRMPRRQSRYREDQDDLPVGIADTLNTEIALYSARQLQEGRIILMLSDSPDRQGRAYGVTLGGRKYQFKAGFAELALTTGAVVVPHWRVCQPDGTIRYEFGQPVEYGSGDRGQQVEGFVHKYADFLRTTWTAHPESVRWGRIRKHLRRPPSTDDD